MPSPLSFSLSREPHQISPSPSLKPPTLYPLSPDFSLRQISLALENFLSTDHLSTSSVTLLSICHFTYSQISLALSLASPADDSPLDVSVLSAPQSSHPVTGLTRLPSSTPLLARAGPKPPSCCLESDRVNSFLFVSLRPCRPYVEAEPLPFVSGLLELLINVRV
jgi:hypothetical protein